MPDAEPTAIDGQNDGRASLASSAKPYRFKLRTLFLLFAIIVVTLAFGGDYVIRKRNVARAAQRCSDLKQMYLGLLNYESVQGALPLRENVDPKGIAISSWRLTVICYMEAISLRCDVDAAWNALSNRDMAALSPQCFCWGASAADHFTSIYAVTGPYTAFDGSSQTTAQLPGDAILLMEAADSQTHWMQPGDYNVTDLLAYKGKIGDHLRGLLDDRLHILFADGEVWALDPDAPIADLQPFLTITGAKTHDREQLLGPHKVD